MLGLVLSSWFVVYTHYTGVFLLVAEFVFLLAVLLFHLLSRGVAKGTFKQISVTLILFVVGCVPLFWQMNQAFGKPADWSSVASLTEFLNEQKLNGLYWFGIPFAAVVTSGGIIALLGGRPLAATGSDRWRQIRWLSWIMVWYAVALLIIVILQSKADIPIALSRYLSVALIAGPIFVGGLVGICSAGARWIAIPIILLASLAMHLIPEVERPYRSSLIVEAVRHGRLPLMRTENWKTAIEVVNDSPNKAKWPLFLFGAVIEDANALFDSDADFQAYLQFPVRSLYEIDSKQRIVFAGPTMSRQHFDDRYLDDVLEQGGAWVLIRHEAEIANEIANQLMSLLQERLANSDATIESNWFGSRENVVRLISIEIKK